MVNDLRVCARHAGLRLGQALSMTCGNPLQLFTGGQEVAGSILSARPSKTTSAMISLRRSIHATVWARWDHVLRFSGPLRPLPVRGPHLSDGQVVAASKTQAPTTFRSGAYDAAISGVPTNDQPQNATGPATRPSWGRWLLDGAAPRLWCGQAISGTRRWAIANSKSRSSSTSARTSSVPVALSLSNCSLFRSIASTLS